MMGLADDGGLVVPESIPNVTDKLAGWSELSYPELAYEIIRLFVTDIPDADLKALIEKSYGPAFDPDVAVTVGVGDLFVTIADEVSVVRAAFAGDGRAK